MNATDLYLPLLFWTFALTSVGGSLAILFVKDIVRCAFLLMLSFSAIAGLYLLLGAEFLAFTQILIYVGGILILILFGVMLTQRNPLLVGRTRVVQLVVPGTLSAAILLAGLVYVSLKVDWVTKAGEEDRVFLESRPTVEPDAKSGDPHALDGWVEVSEKEDAVVVHDAAGAVIARFAPEKGEDGEETRPTSRGITRVWLVLTEDGKVAHDVRGRRVGRTLYGRLSKVGESLVLKDRADSGTVARFEPRPVELRLEGVKDLLDERAPPEEFLPEKEGGTVPVTLYVNAANPREVIDVSLPAGDETKYAYALGGGYRAEPALDRVDEFVTGIGPAMDETPAPIGKALMTDFLLPFEVSSVLLLAALIGATIIARRGGVEGAH